MSKSKGSDPFDAMADLLEILRLRIIVDGLEISIARMTFIGHHLKSNMLLEAKGERLLQNANALDLKVEIPETPRKCFAFSSCGEESRMTFQVLRNSARARRSTLANKETTPKLAEAVPVESEGISAFKGLHPHFLRAVRSQR